MDNEYLIQLIHVDLDEENTCNFYYEYVPLTIGQWVIDMGDELVKELQFELLALANYLTNNGIRFAFEPQCVGLSKDIKIKYFLTEFAIDHQNKLANYKDNEEKINEYFEELRAV